MKGGKQRRKKIKSARIKSAAKKVAMANALEQRFRPLLGPPVKEALLAPYNSYGAPDFVGRGYYVDRPFRCVDCGKEEVWTGSQQK